MQGVVYMPENPQQGSPPPNNTLDLNMDLSSSPKTHIAKEKDVSQSRNDSGIYSVTSNSTLDYSEPLSRTTISSENCDSDTRSDFSSPETKHTCPICSTMLTSQHDFTLHIKSHNSEPEIQHDHEKGYACSICSKVLSSSSSLDRHVLVHSGERPFHCKYCGDTFTTNGNMHRHMRTHSQQTKNYESDGSTDSHTSNKSTEFNNNKVDSRNHKRKLEEEEEEEETNTNKRKHLLNDEHFSQTFKCPVCERTDFNSLFNLEIHLEDNHPDYPVKCHPCNQIFQNYKHLQQHRNFAHEISPNKHSVTGFKDLTFVDFSSEKFPHIARYECEKNLHKVSGSLKFQCKICSRAFPCSSSLEYHQKDCKTNSDMNGGLDLSKARKISESDMRRNDFFARLNLQDNSPEKVRPLVSHIPEPPIKLKEQLLQAISADNSKDLADIQTIISMTTSGSLLQQLQTKNEGLQKSFLDTSHESLKTEQEEETQDAFAMEFRKMKLRGEFPCRLCTAIFPNLRALKGHNRAHLNGNNNGTYRCNMCPHASIDKAALIRHMRTHNGDRPYECSLCNYAFTTKANCERHLRNRHAKTTREDVKKAIIYHPSEDPTNEDLNKIIVREEVVKKNIGSATDSNEATPEKPKLLLSKLPEIRPPNVEVKKPDINPMLNNFQMLKETFNFPPAREPANVFSSINDVIRNENLKTLKEFRHFHNGTSSPQIPPYFPTPYAFAPKMSNVSTPQNLAQIQVKNIGAMKEQHIGYEDNQSDDDYEEEEEPINLVLDLSKKKSNESARTLVSEESPQDLSVKLSPVNSTPPAGDMFAQQLLLKTPPKIDPSALYAQWAFFRNGFNGLPNWPGFPINPLFFQSMQTPISPSSPQEMKERLRTQLCGGAIINDNRLKALQHMHNSPIGFNGFKDPKRCENSSENNFPIPKQIDEIKPLTLNIEPVFNDNMGKLHSPIPQCKPDIMNSPNSVKMVIKNGILMPKQKQRRYRTERPFTCEHCSARFTLRSNMERHIKQQHPQYWSQRQRGNVGNPGRKPSTGLPLKPGYCDLSIPNFELPKNQDLDETKESISEKLKFAILAQHLTSNNIAVSSSCEIRKDDDEDHALVIDENEEKQQELPNSDKEVFEKNRSVLEERLKEMKLKQGKYNFKPALKNEESQDLVPVSRLLDNASQQQFKEFFKRENEEHEMGAVSEEDEEGLVASGSTSEGNVSGTDENRSEPENVAPVKKKSAYSLAPNRVSCPYCSRKFPWTSSLRRHILTHTGQKPFKCSHCPLLFTTKSNCDRHLLRKHGNAATTITNEALNANANYLMRNVPERPFKCSSCPSSTFSTYSNLKKHISCKHATNAQGDDIKAQGYEAGSSEDEKITTIESKIDWESQISQKLPIHDIQNTQLPNSDQPFKCHLCEGSFGERQEALDHIKDKHVSEYELLMSKNALDTSATTPEEGNHHDDEETEIRGKFPDYSNRKVICAFCMRRFWSAEDLRRHMRTHTGERPFSCDICRRRFTLKHSMLRHRKKHNVHFEHDNGNSDEDGNGLVQNYDNNNSGAKTNEKTDESDGNEGNDLISNLLGIRSSFIDKVLTASADDAAKLLGVKNGVRE